MYHIKEPIWKDRSISIARFRVGPDGLDIAIDYKNRQGELVFPDIYHLSYEVAINHPGIPIRGISTYHVPIDILEIKNNK
jgi:hypothetical protein